MEADNRSDGGDRRTTTSGFRQSCCDVEGNNINSGVLRPYCRNNGHQHHHQHPHNHHSSTLSVRNIEIDWREVDPYFSELSDCASFWTLINFTCDVIYSGLFVLFFIMGQDVESMFFEGLLNHINPILIYLILSLIINYGALRSLRCGREKCFLVFSIFKGLLFPITLSLLFYLVFFDVQEYFGTFWVSFVVIVSCYNGTAALGLWSMFTCNKYILVNEAAQKRMRKHAKQAQRSTNNESNCRCGSASSSNVPRAMATSSVSSINYCEHNQSTAGSRLGSMTHSRNKIGDSSTACSNKLNIHGVGNSSSNFSSVVCQPSNHFHHSKVFHSECGPSRIAIMKNKRRKSSRGSHENSEDEGVLSFEDDDEVLQISTVHKVMQEIRFFDSMKDKRDRDISDDGDSL